MRLALFAVSGPRRADSLFIPERFSVTNESTHLLIQSGCCVLGDLLNCFFAVQFHIGIMK